MCPYERIPIIKKDEQPPPKSKPLALFCVAGYQLAKAFYLLLMFSAVWADHESRVAFREQANDPLVNVPSLYVLPVLAALLIAAGIGIWKLNEWARVTPAFLFFGACICWWTMPMDEILAVLAKYLKPDFLFVACLLEILMIAVSYLLPSVTEAFADAKKRHV